MKFMTKDGAIFDSVEDAEKHEDELKEIEKIEKEKETKRKELGKKVEEAYENYCKYLKEYVSTYGEYKVKRNYSDLEEPYNILDLFNSIFG